MSLLPDESSTPTNGENGSVGLAETTETNGKDQEGLHLHREPDQTSESRVLEYLQEARDEDFGQSSGTAFRKYRPLEEQGGQDEDDGLTPREKRASPAGSYSTPDDTPSLHGSVASSSLGGSALSPHYSPSPSLRPFDRRFQSRLQPSSPLQSPSLRSLSPALLGTHSRTSSGESRSGNNEIPGVDSQLAPWEVVRWTKLKKISAQVFSEGGRRNFGTPTCIEVSATIAMGTSKGIILVFDYHQTLKSIIGPGTKAVECGAITALAVSADHTTVAGGHAHGHIFTWELARPSRPFLQIAPLSSAQLMNIKMDGHVEGASVLHLGFLGTRHTALVSADDKGMAFSHLATRGLGAVGRAVKTSRILGRYPQDVAPTGRPRKPSSVLGLSVLPLGNSQEATDSMGLTAMLTPYLLVIVSTTPVAQTQFKTVRPKEVANDSALSGCLAWYPSVKLKQSSFSIRKSSNARLAYCWSNVLTLLELSVTVGEEPADPSNHPVLEFRTRGRFRCEEAIVAVQWISRQIIGVLTVTQRLIILEDVTLRVTETFDLMPKHILHNDVFLDQLRPLVDRMDEEGSIHPHVADSFYNSFKTHKGRMFLLCSYELSVGALSNWADRLLAIMEVGDFIGAIRLATGYYTGEANKLTIGLPEDPKLRHPLVEEKLLEMMAASLRYAFGRNQNSPKSEILEKDQLQDLCIACFDACLSTGTLEFLFEEVYEFFEEAKVENIFLEALEPYVLDSQISSIPPAIVKALISHYTAVELEGRLEEMICHMDTRTLDIDQVTTLCKRHKLYDAMIYVWNRAINDYITPLLDLLSLILPTVRGGHIENGDSLDAINGLKVFPYFAYTLTGRVYPTGEQLSTSEASDAKAQIYYFLFLGTTVTWPKQSEKPFLTRQVPGTEPSFPYLRLILEFDAASFLSALNEAFEDPFLNGSTDLVENEEKQDFSEDQVFGRSVNRQYIVSILIEVMNPTEFPSSDTIYLDMFIARNLPKFPQFILLSGSALHRVLVGLCNPPGEDIADDCQLSVEYLLTVYRPPDIVGLVELFSNAGYYRVLKSIFRAEKQYARLVKTYLDDDESPEAVFECIGDCLRPHSGLNDKQTKEVQLALQENALNLLNIGEVKTAQVIDSYAPGLHCVMLAAMDDRPRYQFSYLQTVLEPTNAKDRLDMKRPEIMENVALVELYIRLMCDFRPDHVSDFVSHLQSGDLRLENVLPAMENSGVMDAAVVLMAREGRIRQAMDRLLAHLSTLETAVLVVLKASEKTEDCAASNEAAIETIHSLQKYARVGVWLCQGQMKTKKHLQKTANGGRNTDKDPLSSEEMLWLDLVDCVVRIAKNGIFQLNNPATNGIPHRAVENGTLIKSHAELDAAKLVILLRQFVQDTFSALLASTSSSQSTSFLKILRAFLVRASIASPSLADLRNVISDIFETYLYEEQLLSLANRLLDKDLFVHVEGAASLRQRGWRPAGQPCQICGKNLWGPGAAGGIYSAWERRRIDTVRQLEVLREEQKFESQGSLSAVARGKSRARLSDLKDVETPAGEASTGSNNAEGGEQPGDLILFNCRHIYHRKCLDNLQSEIQDSSQHDWAFKCTVCGQSQRRKF